MKFMVTLANDGFQALSRRAALAESAGFDAVGIGDSPGFWDVYVSATVATLATSQIAVGPMVTNVVTRAPEVTARTIAALDDLSNGRAFLGLGVGDSAVAHIRQRPATVATLRDGVERITSTWSTDTERRSLGPVWSRHRRPIIVAANGPRVLELAGAVADIAVMATGLDNSSVTRGIEAVHRGCLAAGRSPSDLSVFVVARCHISDDRSEIVDRVGPLLASGANHVFASAVELERAPARHRDAIRELRRRYDYSHHGRPSAENPNVQLVEDLGLTDYLMKRFVLPGTPAAGIQTIRRLEELGVDGITFVAVGGDPDAMIDDVGRHILTALR